MKSERWKHWKRWKPRGQAGAAAAQQSLYGLKPPQKQLSLSSEVNGAGVEHRHASEITDVAAEKRIWMFDTISFLGLPMMMSVVTLAIVAVK